MKNNINFRLPQKESPKVILLIIFDYVIKILRQFTLPIIAILVTGRSKGMDYFFYFAIGTLVFSAIRSILMYFRKSYYIDEDEFIVESGVLANKKVSIPFQRIQNIGYEQNLLHRILQLRKLKIDTAGSAQSEVELNGLTFEVSDQLRDLLLKQKSEVIAELVEDNLNASLVEENKEIGHDKNLNKQEGVNIFSLNFLQLIKAGLFENHLRSLSIIFAVIFYVFSNAREIGVDTDDYVDKVSVIYDIYYYVILSILLMVIAIAISLVSTVLTYFKLSFDRLPKGFRIKRGLFNNVTTTAVDNKIQTLSWSDTWLKKKIGIFDIRLLQASSKLSKAKETIVIPGAHIDDVDEVRQYLYPNLDLEKILMHKVDVAYLQRRIMFSLVFASLLSVLAITTGSLSLLIISIVLMFALPYYFTIKYKKLSFGYTGDFLYLKGGAFGAKNIITPIHKIQSIDKLQSPFERGRGLASLKIYNAAGSEVIPFVKEDFANNIMNLFIYKVETDKRIWL